MTNTITLNPKDNVAVLTAQLKVEGTKTILAPGHKIALTAIARGEPVFKFGQIIGYATEDIAEGEHVHSHNCEIGEHDQDYQPGTDLEEAKAAIPQVSERTFEGYVRADGRVGTRNFIALCSTVNCSATVIRRAAEMINQSGMLDDYPGVDGVVAFAHTTGCGMAATGEGADNLERVLWGHATHPNVAAAIFVGLGCEVMQISRMRQKYGNETTAKFHGLTIQQQGGTMRAVDTIIAKVKELLPEIGSAKRETVSASHLRVALQCGGSDGFSGVTANPALGCTSDMLAALGATAVLAETPEIYGAEQLLLRRASSTAVADKLISRIRWWENYTAMNGASLDNNPSPGNKAGGLTTILEKSLGAAAKGGSTPLNDVLLYGEEVKTPGFVFMDTPGYDPVSATGQIAGGCQIVVFTTGRGSAFGSKPAPTIKLATNTRLYETMTDDMDINCGDVIDKQISPVKKGEEILDEILAVASGKVTKSEALGLGDNEFVPWQVGAVL